MRSETYHWDGHVEQGSAPRRGSREVGKPIKRQPTDKLHLRHAMHCPDVIYVAFRIFY